MMAETLHNTSTQVQCFQNAWFTFSVDVKCTVSCPIKATIDLNIETEADLHELDTLLSQHQHSFAGFARQMWAYITVNQLLAER